MLLRKEMLPIWEQAKAGKLFLAVGTSLSSKLFWTIGTGL
jgi:hypothetical protein